MTTTGTTQRTTADAAAGLRPPFWTRGILALAGVRLGLHLATVAVTPYSVHRDELLYLAMGKYLRFFHMDFPPFIAVLANTARALFGDSLLAIRLFPAVAGSALIVLAALIARELGGGRTAQLLAAVAVFTAPLFLRAGSLFQPVVFDQVWWTLALLAMARIAGRDGGSLTDWLLLGAAGGLGLLTKFSIGFVAVGLAVALLLTPQRRWLLTRWPYVAALIALLIGSASIIGQLNLGLPVLGQMGDLQESQLVHVTAPKFIAEQALLLGPAVLLAILGAVALLSRHALVRWRVVGIACVATFLLLMVLRGKSYYVGPIYPALFAAGGVMIEGVGRGRRYLIAAGIVAMSAFALIILPIALPLASPDATARHAARLGITAAVTTNRGEVIPLPQDFADMLGWREQVQAVAQAYHALPPDDRARAVILARNYGEAGAIDFFGPAFGLPRAVAAAGSYWFFGPGDLPGDVAVALGLEEDDLAAFFGEVTVVERVRNPWGVPEQQDNPVVVARGPLRTIQDVWPELAGRN